MGVTRGVGVVETVGVGGVMGVITKALYEARLINLVVARVAVSKSGRPTRKMPAKMR